MVRKCLQHNPKDRYHSFQEIMDQLVILRKEANLDAEPVIQIDLQSDYDDYGH